MPFDTLDEAVARANATPYGLAAGIFTTHLGTAHKLARRIKAGSVWVNMYHAIDPAVPFGGMPAKGAGPSASISTIRVPFSIPPSTAFNLRVWRKVTVCNPAVLALKQVPPAYTSGPWGRRL